MDEHYSIGTSESENAVGRLRETSIALLIQANLPAEFWPCAIQHSTLLVNYTSRSRANPKLTVYELPTKSRHVQDSSLRRILQSTPRTRSAPRKSRSPKHTQNLRRNGHISKDLRIHGHGYDNKQLIVTRLIHGKSTCARRFKKSTLGTNPSAVSRVLVLPRPSLCIEIIRRNQECERASVCARCDVRA